MLAWGMVWGTEIARPVGRVLLWVGVALAATALAGCDRDIELKRPFGQSFNHVSPTPPVVPRLPPGTFDQARAQTERTHAAAARLSGDAAGARKAAEAAAADWPGDPDNWRELAADCRALDDNACALYADFFGAKVDYVNGLPPRAATLGFASLAQGEVGTHTGDYVYDRRTLDTAARLASFYDARDPISAIRIAPKAEAPAAK